MKMLLVARADINAEGSHGKTPLHEVVCVDELEKVRALLDAGADIEAPSDGGYTPLHFAVRHGNTGAM